MASSPCKIFYQQVSQILNEQKHYEKLVNLFSIQNSSTMYRELAHFGIQDILRACNQIVIIPFNWIQFITQYWNLIMTLSHEESNNIYLFIFVAMNKSSIDKRKAILSSYNALFQSFLKILQDSDSLILPLLFQLVKEFKFISKRADKLSTPFSNTSSIDDVDEQDYPWTTECTRLLQRALNICLNDRNEIRTKKYGVIFMSFQLFSAYLYLQQQSLCNMILKALQASELPSIHSIPKAHYILFHYYLGRIHLYEGRYASSQSAFLAAFRHCLPNHISKKRHILDYLIPLQLLQGHCPTPFLIEKYSLHNPYQEIVQAIHQGHLARYKTVITNNESMFARRGTLILFEKLIMYVYRHLIKHIVQIIDNHKVSLDWFLIPSLINMFDKNQWSIDHIECILCQLIDHQLIRGYLNHEKHYLVLSQKDPFPFIKKLLE